MILSFMGIIIGIGFLKSKIAIGILSILIHPIGGAEPIRGALKIEERHGRQIIEEINGDIIYTAQTAEPFRFSQKGG